MLVRFHAEIFRLARKSTRDRQVLRAPKDGALQGQRAFEGTWTDDALNPAVQIYKYFYIINKKINRKRINESNYQRKLKFVYFVYFLKFLITKRIVLISFLMEMGSFPLNDISKKSLFVIMIINYY